MVVQMQSMLLVGRPLTVTDRRMLVGRQAPGLESMGDGENVWDKIVVRVHGRMHLMADASVAIVVVWYMLMSASKDQMGRWNEMVVEAAQPATEEFGKLPMQIQTTNIQVLPMSRRVLAEVVEEVVEEVRVGVHEGVGMESKVQVGAVLSNGALDTQGIRE